MITNNKSYLSGLLKGFAIAVLWTLTGQNAILQAQTPALPTIHLETVPGNLVAPVSMAWPNDGQGRFYVCEQRGLIFVFEKGKMVNEPFLDIKSKVFKLNPNYEERGLLGLAFHPRYKTNGRFFVYYSAPKAGTDHKSVISEFKVNFKNPLQALTDEKVIMEVDQPEGNHNGGMIAFGPDGYLYIGLGDGGGQDDKHGNLGNGQDMKNILGKILRIDIDGKAPYTIPSDNPFKKEVAAPEIWASGFRNPWRFSFDRSNGRLFVGDVGQNKYEEVDLVEKGKNYGWRVWEGLHCHNPIKDCPIAGYEEPIDEYDHSIGTSVTGGYLYRGQKIKSLFGKYIYADWTGKLFALTDNGKKQWQRDQLSIDNLEWQPKPYRINAFCEGPDGELYFVAQQDVGPLQPSGVVYKITAK